MGKLIFDGQQFWFTPSCTVDRFAAKGAGFVYDGEGLRWHTRNIHKAAQLRQFADEKTERIFKNTFITSLELPEQICYPDHLEPRLFQIESAQHVLTRTPTYLADEQGLGKTITAVLCMNTVPGRVLIICPPFLKYNWVDEIKKWGVRESKIFVVETGTPNRCDLDADIVVLPDSLIDVPCIQHYLKDAHFEWLFVDEAHRYKTADAQRTVALIGSDEDAKVYFQYTHIAKRVAYMSGTPIPNGKPIELYPLLHRTASEAIGHRGVHGFGVAFCDAKQVTRHGGKRAIAHWDYSGASNLKQLRKELHAKLMVRHLKKDVLDELPPKTRKMVFLDSPKELVKFEQSLLKKYTMKELLGDGAKLGDMSRYQKEVGLAKLPGAIEYIRDLLENSPNKLVVFAHHIDVVEGLADGLKDFHPLKIRGGMTAEFKTQCVRKFQAHYHHRVIVGNMTAMGVGLTLTKAPGCVVVEPSWVPGENEQAEDRIHRMTQDAHVYIRYLVMRDSLDERKLRSVMSKQLNISEVMG